MSERPNSHPRPSNTWQDFAAWFADEIVAQEIQWDNGVPMPTSFRKMVAERMVSNPRLGWPTLESADGFLDDLYALRSTP